MELSRGRATSYVVIALSVVLAAVYLAVGNARDRRPAGEATVLRYQSFVGQIGLPDLAADLGYLGNLKLQLISNTISGPQDIQATVTGDVDFGNAFNGSILRLASAGAKITTVISTQGADPASTTTFLVRADSPIRSARDLVGRTVGVNTVGAQNEDVLGMYLERGGVDLGGADTVQRVVISPASMEQALRSRQVDVVALSSSVLVDKAMSHGGVRPLFSDYSVLGPADLDATVMRTQFIRDNPNTVRTLVSGMARALEWTKSRPRDEVIARMISIAQRRDGAQDVSALKYWKTFGVATTGGVVQREDFSIWLDRLQRYGRITPGSVNVDDVYTNDFNPYRNATQQ
jgi:ABC-type nitrate/sulfonate/bicarbonate transport system substrate-binding protein